MLNPMCPLPTSRSPCYPPFFKQLTLLVGLFRFRETWTCSIPGLAMRKAGVWVLPLSPGGHRPQLDGRGHRQGVRARTRAIENSDRRVKVSSKEQLVPGSPRCSCCFQMFQMKKKKRKKKTFL